MIKSKKITCEYSSFIDKLNPEKNYSNYNMVSIGNTTETSLGYHSFRTLLRFNIDDIDKNSVVDAHLSIFIRKIERTDYASSSIGLYIGKNLDDYELVSWDNLNTANPANILNISIPSHITNSYVKINITKLIKNSSTTSNQLNIVLYPSSYDEKYAVILSSVNSKNPPSIEFQIKEANIINDTEFKENTEQEDDKDPKYISLLSKLSGNDLMIKNMQTSINTIINMLIENNEKSAEINTSINNLSESINKADISLNQLNGNIMQLIQNQSSDEKHSTDELNLYEEKISAINSKFDSVESSLDKLTNLLSSLSIETLN